jgi:hypothetical protein
MPANLLGQKIGVPLGGGANDRWAPAFRRRRKVNDPGNPEMVSSGT